MIGADLLGGGGGRTMCLRNIPSGLQSNELAHPADTRPRCPGIPGVFRVNSPATAGTESKNMRQITGEGLRSESTLSISDF